MYRGHFEEAAASLRTLNGADYAAEDEIRLLELQIEEQRELHRASSVLDCFKGTNLHRTVIAMGVQILQQAQGISFYNNFLVTFLQQLNFNDPLLANLWVTSCGVFANLVSLYTFDRIGRRFCMFFGATIMAAMMLGVGGITASGTEPLSKGVKSGATAMLVLWYTTLGSPGAPVCGFLLVRSAQGSCASAHYFSPPSAASSPPSPSTLSIHTSRQASVGV